MRNLVAPTLRRKKMMIAARYNLQIVEAMKWRRPLIDARSRIHRLRGKGTDRNGSRREMWVGCAAGENEFALLAIIRLGKKTVELSKSQITTLTY